MRYHPSSVWHLLHKLGWSCQRPQRQPLQRDDRVIAHWKRYLWPPIKKWRELGATLVFVDESGFSLGSPLKRTWVPRGHTPTVRTSLEHNQRLNLMGTLCVSPDGRKLQWHLRSHWKPWRGEQVIAFLKHLLTVLSGAIVWVWDKHPIHRRRLVRDFLAQHRRIQVYDLPTFAPELNPTEFVWTQLSEYTANSAPHNRMELRDKVLAGIVRARRSQRRLWACIFASDLPWRR